MPTGGVETVYVDGSWTNEIQGEGPTENLYETKERAVEAGRDLARRLRVEHIIKNQDGSIAERNSYGNDPRDVPG